jgi:hypothetical protein
MRALEGLRDIQAMAVMVILPLELLVVLVLAAAAVQEELILAVIVGLPVVVVEAWAC